MSKPATYNFDLTRRADHFFNVNLSDDNGNINLSGKTILSQIWDAGRTVKIADVGITITSASNGNVEWRVTDLQTADMVSASYQYDILKIDANGNREYFLRGTITMSEGYTTQ